MQRSLDQLKRKLRQLKKLEIKIRFGQQAVPRGRTLVWNTFFSTKQVDDPAVRYPLAKMLPLERHELKEIYDEYFYWVYFQNYKESGMTLANLYDPALLSLLDLPTHAGVQDIKRRFRELAKKYHPDRGGDSAQFIELMDVYEQLVDK